MLNSGKMMTSADRSSLARLIESIICTVLPAISPVSKFSWAITNFMFFDDIYLHGLKLNYNYDFK